MASSRDLRRVPITSGHRKLPLDRDHLDGGDGGFEALVSCLQAGAVESLFERLAGEDAEGVGDAGILLRLADATRDLVVDGLVVGGFATQKTAKGDDRVELLRLGEGAGGGGNLPRAGDADDLDIRLPGSAAVEGVERALQ